jgi:hypothetical protein
MFHDVEAGCDDSTTRSAPKKHLRACMPSPPEASFVTDPHALGVYMATMTASLARIARQNGFEALGYLLELAHLEAETIRRQQLTDTDD